MANKEDTLKTLMEGQYPYAPDGLVDAAFEDTYELAVVTALSATMAEFPLPSRMRQPGAIVEAYWVPQGAFTGDNTNKWTFVLKRRAAADYTTALTVATLDLATGTDLVAFTPKTLGTLTNAVCTENDILTLTVTKAAAAANIAGSLVVKVLRQETA